MVPPPVSPNPLNGGTRCQKTRSTRCSPSPGSPRAGYEGYSQQVAGQVATLQRLLREHRPKRILEIGFNAGHSAEIFLSTVADAVLLSFDLGAHAAVRVGKTFIDEVYPGRHTLVVGDSAGSIPTFASLVERTIPAFDFLFIDGGHTIEIATADLANCAVCEPAGGRGARRHGLHPAVGATLHDRADGGLARGGRVRTGGRVRPRGVRSRARDGVGALPGRREPGLSGVPQRPVHEGVEAVEFGDWIAPQCGTQS